MSTADGTSSVKDGSRDSGVGHQIAREKIGVMTLAANLTLTLQYRNVLKIDPAGARDVTLPAEAGADGASFEIVNAADAAEAMTVKDDGGSTIVTISQNEKATVVCDGTSWYHTGIITIALS